MVLKIYGSDVTTCTRRIATILHELQVPFELTKIDLKNKQNKTEEFMKYQPFGQIPYIDDDGFILFETRAIGRYLVAKHQAQAGLELIPSDPKKHALFEQAAAFEQSNFDPAGSEIGLQFHLRRLGWGFDQAVVDRNMPLFEQRLEGYNTILGKTRYLAGDFMRQELTLADLFHLPIAPFVGESSPRGALCSRRKYPNVARCQWMKELSARPSWLAYKDGVVSTLAY
ncbi:hypothetical protein HMN09_00146400 [Mycena chlorophos]|uniref:glutathione transferase n=1 Tax=Mycena chlorophos TaxID=658473 RepID=A0A8H6TMR7_MYCCL|nr:hypothetical protein HMN09_00146400 [Mycena chlorophos]